MQAKALVVEDTEADVGSIYFVEVLCVTLWTSKMSKTYCTDYCAQWPSPGQGRGLRGWVRAE